MIKVFNSSDRDFGTNGNIAIKPIKCIETKKKSLNGWYIDVEIPIEYKDYIDKDKLFVVKTKSKLNPQAFFIKDDVEIKYTKTKIIFQAEHVMFMARDYFLVDVRPTSLNGAGVLNYINERTDKTSPFLVNSNVETITTAYFIRKSLLEAWATIEERWGGVFDADNWTIQLKQNIGQDFGETIAYGKNLQNIEVYEDWSSVVTKLYPTGKDGLMLPEEYLESETQYDKSYTRTIVFETELEEESQTEENLINELRTKANAYLEENQFPKVSYEVTSDINQQMEIGDTIHVKHPLVNLLTEVLEYESDRNTKKVKKIIFGNFTRDVKQRFDSMKSSIKAVAEKLSSQDLIIKTQTDLINNLNKLGNVYITDNEVLILDALPKENAVNVIRLGLGGIGFSTTGYDGEYTTAWTIDGMFNADFIKFGTLDGALIKAGSVTTEKLSVETREEIEKIDGFNSRIATLETKSEGIITRVGDVEIDLTNNYQTSEQVNALFDGVNGELDGISGRQSILEQTASDLKIDIKSINTNGVSKLVNTAFVFDENGLRMSKTGEPMTINLGYFTINNEKRAGLQIKRDNVELLGVDNTGGRMENLSVRKYFVVADTGRMEKYYDGIGAFYIGGED